jgi:hypothetical protein
MQPWLLGFLSNLDMLKYYKSAAITVGLCIAMFSNAMTQQFSIHHFRIDGGKVRFEATKPGLENDSTGVLPGASDDFVLGVPGMRLVPIEGNVVGDSILFAHKLPQGVFPGKHAFSLMYKDDTVFSEVVKVPNLLNLPGTQPVVETLHPRGTSPGRVVTVRGKGFGKNLDNLYIWFTREDGTDLPPEAAQVLNPTPVTYLTTEDATGHQELKFLVPGSNSFGDKLDVTNDTWLEYDLRLRVVVGGQPSANSDTLSVVRDDYQLKLFLMVMALFVAFLVLVWGLYTYMNRKGYSGSFNLKALVIDTASNQYSLAKVQALGWTVILLLSYMYYVLITFVILDRSTIPDFEPSLLILMGITTGGLLIARSTDRSQQIKAGGIQGVIPQSAPSLWDLISENGVINLASLQLLLFTIVSMGVYILFMTDSNLVETGMPSMPTTLLGLMGISQGGYLTGKVVENNGMLSPAVQARNVENKATNSIEVTPKAETQVSAVKPVDVENKATSIAEVTPEKESQTPPEKPKES